jgi:hypothetical protein
MLDDFLKLIDCNWPKDKHGNFKVQDVDAYLNRMHLIVCTDKWMYYRSANSGKALVPRMAYPNTKRPDLFKPEVFDLMTKHKKDHAWRPDGYEAALKWDIASR